MRYLALLLLLPLLANADQNCWISVTTVDADEVKQAVEEKLAAEKPAEEKGVIEEIIEVIKGEPVALSAQKIEAVDVLQKTPKDSTAFFRRPTLYRARLPAYQLPTSIPVTSSGRSMGKKRRGKPWVEEAETALPSGATSSQEIR